MGASKLGFLFELGFGIGAYSYLKQNGKIDCGLESCLNQQLDNTRMGKDNLTSRYRNILKELSRKKVEDNVVSLMWKGFISGYNFCREFIESKTRLRDYTLEYFQANFIDPINDYERGVRDEFLKKLVKLQLDTDISSRELEFLLQKGEFLQADLIVMIIYRGRRKILVVDNAISLSKVTDFRDIDDIKRSLRSTLFHKKQKNKFDNLSVGTDTVGSLEVKDSLSEYIIALNKIDKPLFKLIQAGSYAYSFKRFLERKKIAIDTDIKSVTVVGYTDEDISSLNISDKNLNFLEEMEKTLKKCNEFYKSADRSNNRSSFEDKKKYTFNRLRRNFKEIFGIDSRLSDTLRLKRGLNEISIEDEIENFQNTSGDYSYFGSNIPFREAHSREVICQMRNKENQILFLTGNPGIGKTHSIVEYLKSEESYIFLYLSPRTQVNGDIEKKFKVGARYYSDEFIYLNASSEDEKTVDFKGANIVNFASNDASIFDGVNTAIKFKQIDRERDYSKQFTAYERKSTDEYSERKTNRRGVLSRLSMGIEAVIDKRLSKKILATASIQSLKMTKRGSTASHIARIFSQIINNKTKSIDKEGFDRFTRDYKNIIIMIDEITGDSAGVGLLNEIIRVVYDTLHSEMKIDQKDRINIKLIVADASMTDMDIVNTHIRANNIDTDKIYYKLIEDRLRKPLDIQKFKFRGRYNSVYINSNSYPARKLRVKYNLILDIRDASEKLQKYNSMVKDSVNTKIAKDSFKYMIRGVEQIIIYVQDIGRLRHIVNALDGEYRRCFGRSFKRHIDYIEIHSSISEREREMVFRFKDKVRYIFMTSSASRGISFPNATMFLIDLPSFSIEFNLMEILQLIYRGRGNLQKDINSEKYVEFYIGSSTYYDENFEVKSKEVITTIMSTMMILKAAILTRIKGGSRVGRKDIAIIPIGSKSVSSGESISLDPIGALLRDLKKEVKRELGGKELEDIFRILYNIFKSIKLELGDTIFLERDIESEFISKWKNGLSRIIDFRPLKDAYILGDLAIFKLDEEFEGGINLSAEKIDTIKRTRIIARLRDVSALSKEVPNKIKVNMAIVANILEFFIKESKGKSMRFTDKGENGYIAIPIIVPFSSRTLRDESKGKEENISMRKILEMYVRSEYQIRDVYPFTKNYSNYPFIFFRSESIEATRRRMFNDRHILCSKEINLLKLIALN